MIRLGNREGAFEWLATFYFLTLVVVIIVSTIYMQAIHFLCMTFCVSFILQLKDFKMFMISGIAEIQNAIMQPT